MSNEIIVGYNGKSFWISDSFIELLSQYVWETFNQIGLAGFSSNLLEFFDTLNSNRKGEHTGMVSLLLDDSIVTPADKSSITNVLQQTKVRIQLLGSEITVSDLNQFENNKVRDEFKRGWTIPVKTLSLNRTLDLIIALIDGSFSYSNNILVQYDGYNNISTSLIV